MTSTSPGLTLLASHPSRKISTSSTQQLQPAARKMSEDIGSCERFMSMAKAFQSLSSPLRKPLSQVYLSWWNVIERRERAVLAVPSWH